MDLFIVYNQLKKHYSSLNPHHDTWMLWLKHNKSKEEFFEVAIGTILVQNTNWKNVNKAITNLKKNNILSFNMLVKLDFDHLLSMIKPAGFYNQKTAYLKVLSYLFLKFESKKSNPTRKNLLSCKGIGRETADSILVYCLQQPFPIIGTYTRRFFARYFGIIDYLKKKYETIQNEISVSFPPEAHVLGYFHALIVCHCQNICIKKDPKCNKCILLSHCKYGLFKEKNQEIAKIQRAIHPQKKKK
jgi:endonuclease-3 related protein